VGQTPKLDPRAKIDLQVVAFRLGLILENPLDATPRTDGSP
jgi:hypothetical protein